MERLPCVYLLASGFHGTLYTGVTSDLPGRIWQRQWKIELIERDNPTWRDLAEDFGFEPLIKKVDPGSRPG